MEMTYKSYKILGAHITTESGKLGIRFSVWAPQAQAVGIIGSFNGWNSAGYDMERISQTGIWSLFTSDAQVGDMYKYEITTDDGQILHKADPYAFYSEVRPGTASIIVDLSSYVWEDDEWFASKRASYKQPMNIYEVHLGSWRKHADGTFYTYRDLANELVDYVVYMGYTHIEILPVMEHPFDGSWGYQITGYYSITSRYGTPEDFMYFVDCCHQQGIGVILDWVPGHFCKDCHGLRLFDGSALYEYADEKRADTGEWGTLSFDFGKAEVREFLISNALFWLDVYRVDGLRVDAVASMLYLDFGKGPGEWQANIDGGRENLEAIFFLRALNEAVFAKYPYALMMAEESTAWPLVTYPTDVGGLGFNYKWNMGWMNDMLEYMETEPEYKKYHHKKVTFSFFYAFSENFVLPLSHDEVVHGKKSLLDKMPGDYWQKFANLRLFIGYMMAHPGKKFLFMGGEIGHFIEWDDRKELDWFLLDYEKHRQVHQYVRALNLFYKTEPALWQEDHDSSGFSWIDADNEQQSIIVFQRLDSQGNYVVVLCNFTHQTYKKFKIGVPDCLNFREIFNSDAIEYGGSGVSNTKLLKAVKKPWHNQTYSLELTVPPLAIVVLQPVGYERSVKTCTKNNV